MVGSGAGSDSLNAVVPVRAATSGKLYRIPSAVMREVVSFRFVVSSTLSQCLLPRIYESKIQTKRIHAQKVKVQERKKRSPIVGRQSQLAPYLAQHISL